MRKDDSSERRMPSRREVITLGIGTFVVGALPLARSRRRTLVRRSLPVMGTIAELGVVHRDARFAQGALNAAVAELVLVEQLMSPFLAGSDIARANRSARARPVPVSQATARVLRAALQWADGTDGAFDPCLGSAIALWDVKHRNTPPAPADLRRLAGRRLYRKLELTRDGPEAAVVRHDADVAIDLGGIAKGYAVDRAVAALRSWGVADGLVNVGGDLYALGVSENGDAWDVGVQSAEDPQHLATTLRVADSAVATSGDYLQYFEHGGRRYHHLLDPRTAEPTLGAVRSLTVAAADCMSADAAATALFGIQPADAGRILSRIAPGAVVLHRA